MRLTEEEKILLELISDSKSDNDNLILNSENKTQVDWESVKNESSAQAVNLLAFDSVKKYEKLLPEEVYEMWFSTASGALMFNLRLMEIQSKVVNMLDNIGVKFVILKGTAASEYYSNPELRALGDIDILINESDLDKVTDLFISKGLTKEKEENECHVVFRKGSVSIEVHYQISGVPFGKVGDRVLEFMSDVIASANVGVCEFGKFYTPKPEYHGLITLLHMQHHMLGEGLGLRHLCDWERFVRKTINETFWREKLIPLLKEIGLYTYAKAITKTCAIYLGGILPEWVKEIDDGLCLEIITDVLKGGNFGRKDKARSSSGALISEHGKAGTKHGKVHNAFKFTHRVVVIKYPIVKKVFILYPFLFGYRILRYLTLRIFGKRPSLTKTIEMANERKSVYDKLHVFETE